MHARVVLATAVALPLFVGRVEDHGRRHHTARRAHAVVVDGFRDAAKRAALEARAALPAPRAILRCVDAAVGSELAAGLEVEGREFQALKATPEARRFARKAWKSPWALPG